MASQINAEFIERYQIEYQKNPRSRVFAPLAEAYRKMGLLDEALQVANAGVKLHPDFASGRVALAKVLLDRGEHADATEHLLAATRLSPDNLLAHLLLGETWLALRKPKEALKSFKMVLFIDPQNAVALAAVKKWEFLTADEYDEALFSGVGSAAQPVPKKSTLDIAKEVDRAISLADALTVRNEPEKAYEALKTAASRLPEPSTEITNRLQRLRRRLNLQDEETAEPLQPLVIKTRRQKLEMFLRRIEDRRLD